MIYQVTVNTEKKPQFGSYVAEIISYTFLAKIPWKQLFY